MSRLQTSYNSFPILKIERQERVKKRNIKCLPGETFRPNIGQSGACSPRVTTCYPARRSRDYRHPRPAQRPRRQHPGMPRLHCNSPHHGNESWFDSWRPPRKVKTNYATTFQVQSVAKSNSFFRELYWIMDSKGISRDFLATLKLILSATVAEKAQADLIFSLC